MSKETHYDVLNLRKDCTQDEVRKAFLQLSKKYHPDTAGQNSDPKNTAQFIKISEAYQVLSKQHSRADYDQNLLVNARPVRAGEVHRPWQVKPDFNPNPGPYYGIKGMGRISNSKVAWFFTAVAVLGGVVGFFGVLRSYSQSDKVLSEKSEKASSHHASVRADALKYGNEEQMKRIAERVLKTQNR